MFNKGLTQEQRTKVNKDYILRFKDSTGKVSLIGAGQLHKKIGTRGTKLSQMMVGYLERNIESPLTFNLKRGVQVTFTKR